MCYRKLSIEIQEGCILLVWSQPRQNESYLAKDGSGGTHQAI